MQKGVTTNETKKIDNFNPMAWALLFFAFWITLKTVINASWGQNIIANVSLAMSIFLWLSILIPPLRKWLAKPGVEQIYRPTIYIISLTGYFLGWILNWPDLNRIDMSISVYFGTILVLTYLMILIRASGRIIGSVASLVLLVAGVVQIVNSNISEG